MRKLPTLAATLTLTLAAFAGGDGDLDAVRLGRSVCGPALTIEQCKGSVILLEFWGTH